MPSRVRSPTPAKTETPPCSRRDVVDQLLDEDRLADARAAEQADLAAADERSDQVDDLDPGLEDLDLRRQVAEGGRIAVDRPALDAVGRRRLLVDRLADHVPEPPERHLADRHRDRPSEVDDVGASREAVRRVHGDRADAVVAEVLLYLGDQVVAVQGDAECAVDLRQLVREERVDDDALDLDQRACVGDVLGLSHSVPVPGEECLTGRAFHEGAYQRPGVYRRPRDRLIALG